MKMRELERRTGVNRETIRVYFRKGLLPEPQRPKPNVADYDEAHVSSILAIRELQDRRIPLHRIKQAMEGDSSAIPSDAGAFARLESLVAARVGVDDALIPLDSMHGANSRAASDAQAFAKVGAIQLQRRGGKLWLTRTDAQLLGLWGRMRAAGFSEEQGFRPGVVKIYVDAAQALAHAEVGEFLSTVRGRASEGQAAELAQTALNVMLDFFAMLRMKAVLAEFRAQTEPARTPRKEAARRA